MSTYEKMKIKLSSRGCDICGDKPPQEKKPVPPFIPSITLKEFDITSLYKPRSHDKTTIHALYMTALISSVIYLFSNTTVSSTILTIYATIYTLCILTLFYSYFSKRRAFKKTINSIIEDESSSPISSQINKLLTEYQKLSSPRYKLEDTVNFLAYLSSPLISNTTFHPHNRMLDLAWRVTMIFFGLYLQIGCWECISGGTEVEQDLWYLLCYLFWFIGMFSGFILWSFSIVVAIDAVEDMAWKKGAGEFVAREKVDFVGEKDLENFGGMKMEERDKLRDLIRDVAIEQLGRKEGQEDGEDGEEIEVFLQGIFKRVDI